MKYLFLVVMLCLYEIYFLTWQRILLLCLDCRPKCFMDMLEYWKLICRAVGPTLVASLESVAYCRYFLRCSIELAEVVPFPHSGRHYSIFWNNFVVTNPRCHKNINVNSLHSLSPQPFPFLRRLNKFRKLLQVGDSDSRV